MTQQGGGWGQRPPQGPPPGPPGMAQARPPQPNGPNGRYKGKAIEWAFGKTGTGKEQIAVVFELTEGEFKGKQYQWFGFFHDPDSFDRTCQSLIYCGWDAQDFRALAGMGTREPSLSIEPEFYAPPAKPGQATKPGAWRWKVEWVNDPDSDGIAMKERYSAEETSDFASRMSGNLAEFRNRMGSKVPAPAAAKAPAGPAPAAQNGGQQQAAPPQRQPAPADPQADDSDAIPF